MLIYSASADPGSALISCIFLSPPLVTNNLLALESCGKTLLNCPTTCASWSKGSSAGKCTHFCRIFLSAFLLWNWKQKFVYRKNELSPLSQYLGKLNDCK